ncbi:MAG: M48 family metalloprotease [Myxococcales bacterium]|nr:M48 family metalloprotease [Myxococcales bacterium]
MRALFVALCLVAACAGPRGAPSHPQAKKSLAVDDDAELGRLADQQVMSEVIAVQDRALQRYVDGVLGRISAHADPGASRWTLRLLDTSHVSIRSGPGGYIYLTRGLLAFLGSEAELAAALAHEVAHVSMRHWRKQAEYLVKRGIEDGDVTKLGSADRRALLARLRDEEHEADRLALGYLERAGYARTGLQKVIRLFAELERLAGGSRVPASLRTHPATRERLDAIAQRATPGGESKTAEYLSKIDGLPFGEDPRDGYLLGDRYLVPNADFELALPPAWRVELVGRDLMAALPGRATILLVARSEHADLESTLSALGDRSSFRQVSLGDRPVQFSKQPRESGLTALSWVIDAPHAPLVMALIVPSGEDDSEPVRALTGGVRRITQPELQSVGRLRVRVHRLSEPRSLRALVEASPTHTNLATLALLNGVDPDRVLPVGSWVKRVEP